MLRERYGIVSIDSKIRKVANIDHNFKNNSTSEICNSTLDRTTFNLQQGKVVRSPPALSRQVAVEDPGDPLFEKRIVCCVEQCLQVKIQSVCRFRRSPGRRTISKFGG